MYCDIGSHLMLGGVITPMSRKDHRIFNPDLAVQPYHRRHSGSHLGAQSVRRLADRILPLQRSVSLQYLPATTKPGLYILLDFESNRTGTGHFGINIHRANRDRASMQDDDYSAGCQGICVDPATTSRIPQARQW